jgi:hypothetical protein
MVMNNIMWHWYFFIIGFLPGICFFYMERGYLRIVRVPFEPGTFLQFLDLDAENPGTTFTTFF